MKSSPTLWWCRASIGREDSIHVLSYPSNQTELIQSKEKGPNKSKGNVNLNNVNKVILAPPDCIDCVETEHRESAERSECM